MKSKKALARIAAAAAKQEKVDHYKSYFRGMVGEPILEPVEDLARPVDDALANMVLAAGRLPTRNSLSCMLQAMSLLGGVDTSAVCQIGNRLRELSQQTATRRNPDYGTVTGRASSPHPAHVSQGGRLTVEEWARAVAATTAALDGMSSILPAHHDFITLHSHTPPIEGDDA